MVFEKGQRIVFVGDSITDAGRRQEAAPYGNGYVHMARALLLARYPELELDIVNRGVSGDTVRHLAARWRPDVIDERPDWLSVEIGINDVWRNIDGQTAEADPVEEYEATCDRLLTEARVSCAARLILMEPYVIEAERADRFRTLVEAHIAAVHRLAERHDAILVRTQAAFDKALRAQPSSFWADDRVHPGAPGHAVIARAWLRAIDYGDV
ncbi:MAG: SGNH/GDSL hydrolase family protein [Candidatus Dormibacteraeota bacterium]|nr:SGNH/GDSL hydrolase family protein [Candidatus Dormibacteraeota bacterium]